MFSRHGVVKIKFRIGIREAKAETFRKSLLEERESFATLLQGGEGEGFEVGESRVSREEVAGGSCELGCRFRTLELEEEDNDIAVPVRLARIGNKSTLAEVEEILPVLAGESKTCQLIQKRNVVRGLFEKFPEEGFCG